MLTLIALLLATSPAVTAPVSFKVTNPLEPFVQRTVRGTLYEPAATPRCDRTAVLLLHGLSYGAWAWDFPLDQPQYSMARALAARGFAAVAIDELGYGSSDHPNGWNLTVQSYGAITSQIVSALKSGRYQAAAPVAFTKVALFGHSAGSEMSEIAAGQFHAGDALIASSYNHFPSLGILLDVLTAETPHALLSPYIYFGDTPSQRAADMYDLATADPAVVAADTQFAQLTPSGEILSISPEQPSRVALPLITQPVLLIMAENDVLFPPQVLELALFTGSLDKSFYLVPAAGHSFMLHPCAAQSQAAIGDWLSQRLPRCF